MLHIAKDDLCIDGAEAFTMPVKFYIDPDFFSKEREQIFTRSWIAVMGCSDLTQPNDFATVTVSGENILLVRGRDDVLRGFYNVCPHRAHELLQGSGKARNVITCPYHAWTFGLDGELVHARNCDNVASFNKDNASLVPVQVEEFCGLVFVNLDMDAPPLKVLASGMHDEMHQRLPNVDRLIRCGAHRLTHTTKSNWKAIVDNYLECYHCHPTHPGFVASVDMNTYRHDLHGIWTQQVGTAKASAGGYAVEAGTRNMEYAGFYLWPSVMFNVTPGDAGMMTVNTMVPIDADTTLQHYDFYLPDVEPTAKQLDVIAYYRDVFRAEDISLCESVQRGMHSRGFRGQGRVMADASRSGISEHGIVHFHKLFLDNLEA